MVEGRELRLNGPNDLALAPDGLYIWFCEHSPHRLSDRSLVRTVSTQR